MYDPLTCCVGTLLGRWSGLAFLIGAHSSRGFSKSWEDLGKSSPGRGTAGAKALGPTVVGKSRGITEAAVASGAATDWEAVGRREMGSCSAWTFPESGGSHWKGTLSRRVMGPDFCFKRANQAPGWRMGP